MAQRRSLMEGLHELSPEADPKLAEDFIINGAPKSPAQPNKRSTPPPAVEQPEGKGGQANQIGRSPLTIRFRNNFAAALKRASLERQLNGVKPNTLQDILEEAVEPWLRTNGYLN